MNKNPNCPRCASPTVIKSGKIKGKQRYRCKQCGMQFTGLTPRGHPATEKATAIILYSLGVSMNTIAKFLKVSAPAVLYWIRDFAQKHCEKPKPSRLHSLTIRRYKEWLPMPFQFSDVHAESDQGNRTNEHN